MPKILFSNVPPPSLRVLLVILLALLVGVSPAPHSKLALTQAPSPRVGQVLADPLGPSTGVSSEGPSTPELIFQALTNGEIDEDTAYLYLAYALAGSELLPERFISSTPWSSTIWYAKLMEALPALKSTSIQSTIQAIFTGSCYTSSAAMPNVLNSTHFHIEYDTIAGGLTINDYRDALEAAWSREITLFGHAAPPVLTSNPPPGNRYHVRIDTISDRGITSPTGAHAGLVGDNPNTPWTETGAYASCIVLRRDFSGLNVPALQAMRASSAHELHHAVQFGLGALSGSNRPDDIFIEGSAAWMEDEVWNDSNANYRHLWPDFNSCMGEYLGSNEYSYWIVFRGLTEMWGTGDAGGSEQVMQEFWEKVSQGTGMLDALNLGLAIKGTNLSTAFHNYAIAVKFNKACQGLYSYPYCLAEGPEYVTEAGATPQDASIVFNGSTLQDVKENYAINWIGLPLNSLAYNIYVIGTDAKDIRVSVVCDTGSQLNVNTMVNDASTTNTQWYKKLSTLGCSSVVAVITSLRQTAVNPTSCADITYKITATNIIFVNKVAISPWYGTSDNPYKTVGSALGDAPAGGAIQITTGSYPETLTINQEVELRSDGGVVTIGQ